MPKAKKVERPERNVRTTVSLPKPLYEEARSFVTSRPGRAESLNAFFVEAISAYVQLYERKQIDARFAAMSQDADYQKEAMLISDEFSQSDWEALARYGE